MSGDLERDLEGQNTLSNAVKNFLTGDVNGFYVEWESTTSVNVKKGFIEANGKYYTLSADSVHNMISLLSAFGHHYIYLDDSASTPNNPVIIDSLTAPTWDADKNGFYNGDDRMIDVVISPDSAVEVAFFNSILLSDKTIQQILGSVSFPQLANNQNPTGTWQTPNLNDSDVVVPVNAISMLTHIQNTDAGTDVRLFAFSKESADKYTSVSDAELRITAFDNAAFVFWVTLGESRQIRITGTDTNDNLLDVFCKGFKTRR